MDAALHASPHAGSLSRRAGSRRACALALAAALACRPDVPPIAPAELPVAPSADAAAWARERTPNRALRYHLRWSYETRRGEARGRAVVQFVPPDSLRIDLEAPLGRRGAAVVWGDRVVWAEPEEALTRLAPSAELLWAMLGVPRGPRAGAAVTGRMTETERVWRYVSRDTAVTYVVAAGPPPHLRAQIVSGSTPIGTAFVELDPASGVVRRGRTLIGREALFTYRVNRLDTLAAIHPSVWQTPGEPGTSQRKSPG